MKRPTGSDYRKAFDDSEARLAAFIKTLPQTSQLRSQLLHERDVLWDVQELAERIMKRKQRQRNGAAR